MLRRNYKELFAIAASMLLYLQGNFDCSRADFSFIFLIIILSLPQLVAVTLAPYFSLSFGSAVATGVCVHVNILLLPRVYTNLRMHILWESKACRGAVSYTASEIIPNVRSALPSFSIVIHSPVFVFLVHKPNTSMMTVQMLLQVRTCTSSNV